jgi:hypothetical protein
MRSEFSMKGEIRDAVGFEKGKNFVRSWAGILFSFRK